MQELLEKIEKRRTFAIISHPDAGIHKNRKCHHTAISILETKPPPGFFNRKTSFISIARIKIRIRNSFITFRFIALYYKSQVH